jgi:hypothetical protein
MDSHQILTQLMFKTSTVRTQVSSILNSFIHSD